MRAPSAAAVLARAPLAAAALLALAGGRAAAGEIRVVWDRHDLSTTQVQQLEVALQQEKLLPPPGGRMTPFAYLQSFAAVLFLEKKLGKEALLAVVRRTMERGTFEQALDAELRWTTRNVEEGFAYWVDHLR